MMTDVSLFLWQIVLWGLLGIALVVVMAIWVVIALATVQTVARFIKAFNDAKDIEEEELY